VTLCSRNSYVRRHCPAPSCFLALTCLIQAPDEKGKIIYLFSLTWDPLSEAWENEGGTNKRTRQWIPVMLVPSLEREVK